MKTVGTGIFILLVIGLIFFTIQIVKQADFAVVPAPQNQTETKRTFIDIKTNTIFEYPESWILQYSSGSAQYAPVFKGDGYFGVSRMPMKRYDSPAEDLEFYSEDAGFRSFLNEVVLLDLARRTGGVTIQTGGIGGRQIPITPIEANEIKIEKAKQLTLKSGIPGFSMQYSVGNIKGTVYFVYSYDKLLMMVSAYSGNQSTVSDTRTIEPEYAKFRSSVEAVMNTLVTI